MVSERGEGDRNRIAKLFQFSGPDQDTQAVLRNNLESWKFNPDSIWAQPASLAVGSLNTEAGIVGCYIQTKRGDA